MTFQDKAVPTVAGENAAFAAAREVAAHLAPLAALSEKAGKPPQEGLDLLRKAGLLGFLVPERLGGPGGSWPDALKIVRIIAAANGSLGQLLGYHYLNFVTARLVSPGVQADAIEREAGEKAWFFADSVNPLDQPLTVTRDGGDYVLNGRKTFSTGALISDRVLLAFIHDGLLAFAALPRDREGFTPNDDFDFIGLRESVSGTVDFTNVRIHAAEVLGQPVDPAAQTPYATLLTPLIQTIFSHVYLGIAAGALATALDYTRSKSRAWFLSGVETAVEDPHTRRRYGELAAALDGATAFADAVALTAGRALEAGPALTAEGRGDAAIAASKLKVVATQVALDVTASVFELTGARSAASSLGLDRFWRDVRTHSLHDPVAYKADDVGNFLLTGTLPLPTFYS